MSNKDLTSFCGLWCKDCIPSNDRLYSLTSELYQLLADINFEKYADFKSKRVPEFQDYNTFINVLSAIEKLRCYNYCRNEPHSEAAGCSKLCKMIVCPTEKGFEGCWECDAYASCEQITKMERFHPDIKHNLKMIKEHGIEGWNKYRGKHYRWSKQCPE